MHGLIRPSDTGESAPQPVLIVLHQEMSTPGRVGHHLQARGFRLDIRRPALGDPLPETLADHAAIVVFGGPMSANDETDFIKREIDWLSAFDGSAKLASSILIIGTSSPSSHTMA